MKSYVLKPMGNKAKTRLIERVLLPEWRRLAKLLMDRHIIHYYMHGEVCASNSIYKDIPSTLSERYKDCVNRQVAGMIKSKITNTAKKVTRAIQRSKLDKDAKMRLNFVAKHGMFFRREAYASAKFSVGMDDIRTARKIFKNVLGRWPSTSRINMQMQDKVAKVEDGKGSFAYMVKLSTNVKGEPIWLPIKNSPYADRFSGKQSSSVEFQFKKDAKGNDKLKCVKITKAVKEEKLVLGNKAISMDIGLKTFIALDNGGVYGMRMMRKLKWFDSRLLAIQKAIKDEYGKKAKLSKFPAYSNMQHRLRQYLKNEVNRIMNRIMARWSPKQVNMEALDFRGSRLSKKMNRLLSRFGLGVLGTKLESLKLRGLKVVEVDAAYSSQCCAGCGHVDAANRKVQALFACVRCGRKRNADYNAAQMVGLFSERFGEERFYNASGRERKVKELRAKPVAISGRAYRVMPERSGGLDPGYGCERRSYMAVPPVMG